MEGKDKPDELRGIIPRTFQHVFDNISIENDKEFLVRNDNTLSETGIGKDNTHQNTCFVMRRTPRL
jgi:hypothetical protein